MECAAHCHFLLGTMKITLYRMRLQSRLTMRRQSVVYMFYMRISGRKAFFNWIVWCNVAMINERWHGIHLILGHRFITAWLFCIYVSEKVFSFCHFRMLATSMWMDIAMWDKMIAAFLANHSFNNAMNKTIDQMWMNYYMNVWKVDLTINHGEKYDLFLNFPLTFFRYIFCCMKHDFFIVQFIACICKLLNDNNKIEHRINGIDFSFLSHIIL